MKKPLCIVESSSKCPKIVSFLNNQYDCIATGGHICEIANGLKSLDLNNVLKTKFKTKSCAKLRGAINTHSEIILATDNDREGESIAWHICRIFKLDETKTKRILFNEITKPAIQNAINNPTLIDMNMVKSQITRQIVDILVGFKISPLLWKNISSQNTLSAGRCQTPTLLILKEHEESIETNKPEISYITEGFFSSKNIKFKLNKNIKKGDILLFYNKLKNYDFYLSLSDPKKSELKPPYPLVTSTLQQHMGNTFGYSTKKTMTIAQSLYQKGYITYIRTDSAIYSPEFKSVCSLYISENFGDKYVGNPRVKKIKNSQEAHEAIRPTNLYAEVGALSSEEKKIFNEIKKITIQSCMSNCLQTIVEGFIDAPMESKFIKKFIKITFNGWKILSNEQETYYDYILNLNIRKPITNKKITSTLNVLNKKCHMTEFQLVKKIEEMGIGRPSTYSSLIEKLKERNYIEKKDINGLLVEGEEYTLKQNNIIIDKIKKYVGEEKNKLVITTLGKEVLEYLLRHFKNIFNYEFTSQLENKLDNIALNKELSHDICNSYMKSIKECIPNDLEEYEIKPGYIVKTGKYGPYIKHNEENIKLRTGITIDKIKNENLTFEEIIYKETNIAHLTENISIRNGKYGWYIFYKTNTMSKPQFYTLKKYNFDINSYDKIDLLKWINNNYNIYG